MVANIENDITYLNGFSIMNVKKRDTSYFTSESIVALMTPWRGTTRHLLPKLIRHTSVCIRDWQSKGQWQMPNFAYLKSTSNFFCTDKQNRLTFYRIYVYKSHNAYINVCIWSVLLNKYLCIFVLSSTFSLMSSLGPCIVHTEWLIGKVILFCNCRKFVCKMSKHYHIFRKQSNM